MQFLRIFISIPLLPPSAPTLSLILFHFPKSFSWAVNRRRAFLQYHSACHPATVKFWLQFDLVLPSCLSYYMSVYITDIVSHLIPVHVVTCFSPCAKYQSGRRQKSHSSHQAQRNGVLITQVPFRQMKGQISVHFIRVQPSKCSVSATRSIRTHLLWVSEVPSAVTRRQRREAEHSLPPSAQIKNSCHLYGA